MKSVQTVAAIAAFNLTSLVFGGPAFAANVAVINASSASPDFGQIWCQFLQDNGHQCTVFPASGPTLTQLAPYVVVIDLSDVWTDPDGVLADVMRARKGVITWYYVPDTLQLFSNPLVQAWIGANTGAASEGVVLTIANDPILGNRPPGTAIGNCMEACSGVYDTTGHPGAKPLAVYSYHPDRIAILRNAWEGGQSVYLPDFISPLGLGQDIVLSAVEVLSHPIPATSPTILTALGILILLGGTVVLRRYHAQHAIRAIFPAFAFLAASSANAQGSGNASVDHVVTTVDGITSLRLGDFRISCSAHKPSLGQPRLQRTRHCRLWDHFRRWDG